MDEKGFTIEVTSRYEGWWRYNVALMCGCFDDAGRRIGFVSSASTVADAGSNLPERPAGVAADRTATLQTMPCDHLVLYLYIIPHTLPAGNEIDANKPFGIEVRISYAGRRLRTEKRAINQWSGASAEMRVDSKK